AQISGSNLWGNQLDGTITANGDVPFTVDYMGVHFSADPSLANSIWPEVKPATPLPEDLEGPSYWLAIPEHIRFTFADPNLSPSRRQMGFNLAAEGQILIFPLAELVDINQVVQTQIETLQTLLTERGSVPSGELPLLPLTNSAQVFHAQVQYLGSENIQGLRFISQQSQDPAPILLGQELFYTFQGFTTDGAYYVAAFFPLTTAILPEKIEVDDWNAFHANYDTYLSETTAGLDQLLPAEFTPDITLLDAVVTSLLVETDDGLFGESTPPFFVEFNTNVGNLFTFEASCGEKPSIKPLFQFEYRVNKKNTGARCTRLRAVKLSFDYLVPTRKYLQLMKSNYAQGSENLV
ncbi:MAG: hypothetical protein ACWGN2_09525, partial [Anaerolineales bacterium]